MWLIWFCLLSSLSGFLPLFAMVHPSSVPPISYAGREPAQVPSISCLTLPCLRWCTRVPFRILRMWFREPAQVPSASCPCPTNDGSSSRICLCAAQMKVLTLLRIFVVSVGCCDLLVATEGSTDPCLAQYSFPTHAPVHTPSSNSSCECLTLVAYLAATLALRRHRIAPLPLFPAQRCEVRARS